MTSKQPSQNSIGRSLGLSSAAMVKLKKQGMPVDSVESAQAWRQARQNIAKRKPVPPGAQVVGGDTLRAMIRAQQVQEDGTEMPESHDQAKTRREIAEANMAEIELAQKRGEIIQVKAVEAVWSNALASAREHLLQVRARLAPLLAVETETFQIEQLLDLEHNKALNFMSGVQLPGANP